MFLNDEWITENQVYQLDNHHQILYIEGKYGKYLNETPSLYFQTRSNILQYTSYLPIISYPTLSIIKFVGDNLIFIIITIFTLLLILSGLLLKEKTSGRFILPKNRSIIYSSLNGGFLS